MSNESKSASVVFGLIWPSDASLVSSTTSSPGATSTMGGTSGCQRLWPVCGSSRRRLSRSIVTLFIGIGSLHRRELSNRSQRIRVGQISSVAWARPGDTRETLPTLGDRPTACVPWPFTANPTLACAQAGATP